MAKVIERANASAQAQKEAQYALKGFPKSKLAQAFGKIAEQATGADQSNKDKSAAAYDVCMLAHKFRATNSSIPLETVVKGWSEAMNGVAMILAAEGNRFAEIRKGKGNNPDSATLTGYGDNVKSIAKGVLEFELDPAAVLNDKGETGFRIVRTRVQELRQEVRQDKNPDLASMKDATAKIDKAWNAVRTAALGFKDIGVLNNLSEHLAGMLAKLTAEAEAQAATAKAAAEAAAKEKAAADAKVKAAAKVKAEEPTEENTQPEAQVEAA